MFTELEAKLIRLAMDGAAHPGERDNCASKLVASLLRRGISSDELLRLSGPRVYEPARDRSQGIRKPGKNKCPHCGGLDWGSYILDLGKYKGKSLREIFAREPGYLQWGLRELPGSKPHVVEAIKRFFEQR